MIVCLVNTTSYIELPGSGSDSRASALHQDSAEPCPSMDSECIQETETSWTILILPDSMREGSI